MLRIILKSTIRIFILVSIYLCPNLGYAQNTIVLDSLVNELELAKTDSAKVFIMAQLANYEIADKKEEVVYLKQGLEFAKEYKLTKEEGAFLNKYGRYHVERDEYSNALEYYQEAIRIASENNHTKVLISSYFNVGALYYLWKNYPKSEEYIIKALEISELHQEYFLNKSIYNGIGSVNNELKNHHKAKVYMRKYLQLCMADNDNPTTFLAYINLAVISKKLIQVDSSKYYARLAYQIARKGSSIENKINIANKLADIFMDNHDYDSSAYYVSEALELLKGINSVRWQIKTYGFAFDHYRQVGEPDTAMYYMERFYTMRDSVFNKEQLNKITGLETQFETEHYQVKIDNLEQQNKIRLLQLYGSIAGIALLTLVLFLGFRYYKLRSRLLAKDQALTKKKALVLKERVEFQQRDMVSNALYMINQNKLFDSLLKDLKKLNKLPEEERIAEFQSMIRKIKINKQSSEKKKLEIKFKRTHQGFFEKLKEINPDLTKRDLDLCAYLKLNMSTKEIASLSVQSIRAIETARSRLRKKLNVLGGENLGEYIRKI